MCGKKVQTMTLLHSFLVKPDDGERTALWRLEGAIESTLVEVFATNYHDLIRQAKDTLTAE